VSLAFAVSLALTHGSKNAYQPDAQKSSHASMLPGRLEEAYRAFSLALPPTASV
jgi:hypothetical protein